MGLEARQYLGRLDVRTELQSFANRQARHHGDLALSELRKPSPITTLAVAHAAVAQAYEQLMSELQIFLNEEPI